MWTDRRRRAAALALAAPAALASAPGAAGAQGAAPAAPRSAAPARPRHTAADAAFMRDMLGHHAQALAMTALVPARAGSAAVRLVAERIDVSQRDEIAMMRTWLADRGERVPDTAGAHAAGGAGRATAPGATRPTAHDSARAHAGAHDAHGAAMPGMLTAGELARLAGARGAEFDRLFLTYMIRHHEGALTMVRRFLATPGAAQESQTFGFASDVDADQRAEIARMRALLRPSSPPPRSRS